MYTPAYEDSWNSSGMQQNEELLHPESVPRVESEDATRHMAVGITVPRTVCGESWMPSACSTSKISKAHLIRDHGQGGLNAGRDDVVCVSVCVCKTMRREALQCRLTSN